MSYQWILSVKYSPDQPREPAGGPGGGRWTSGSSVGITAASSLAQDDLFDVKTGNLRNSGELAETLGLTEKREGYARTYNFEEAVSFKVKGIENEWRAWLKRGRGRQKGKKYMYLSKVGLLTYLSYSDTPIPGDNITFRTEYPGGDWKEVY